MFGGGGGGQQGMWPPGTFNGHFPPQFMYPSAAAAAAVSAAPQAAAAVAAASTMMQRQLGQSHLLQQSRLAPGGRASMMPPPLQNLTTGRTAELQEKRKAEAEKRRRAEEERQKEAKEKEAFMSELFEKPQKINSSSDDQVAQVLGSFHNAPHIMNCIGVDYQPPTPAPSQHIIGEEDDLPSPTSNHHSKAMLNPAQALYGQHSNQYRQRTSAAQPHQPPSRLSMQPPQSSHVYHSRQQQLQQQHANNANRRPQQANHASMGPPTAMAPAAAAAPNTFRENNGSPSGTSRLKDHSKNISRLNLDKANDDINKIFSEMINPLGGLDSVANVPTMMPPPLSAIITPRVTVHEGNNARSIPKYFPTVSPPPSPIKPLKPSPEREPDKNHGLMASHAAAPPGIVKPLLSEDSESDHEKPPGSSLLAFNPCVSLIEKKPPSNSLKNNGHHSSSDSSESDDSSSDDTSSDDLDSRSSRKKAKKENKLSSSDKNDASLAKSSMPVATAPSTAAVVSSSAADADEVDNKFSLNNLLNKVKKQSPGPASIPPASNLVGADVSPDDISEFLSKNRSPFPSNLIIGSTDEVDGAAKSILDISRPLSPLSPLPVPASSSRKGRVRKTRPKQKMPLHEDTSDEEESKNHHGGRPMPRKNALALTSASQEEEEDMDESLGGMLTNRKRTSKKSRKPATLHASNKSAIVKIIDSSDDDASTSPDEDDESKDVSYGLGKIKSPTKKRKANDAHTPSRTIATPSRAAAATPTRSPRVSLPPVSAEAESAKKREAISRIFPVGKKGPSNGGGGKAGVKVEVKTEEPMTISNAASILKRLDGRPILLCRISFDCKNNGRERRPSTSSSRSSKSSKKRKVGPADLSNDKVAMAVPERQQPTAAECLPGATDLEALPGFKKSENNKSQRNLMPPPDRRDEESANGANNTVYMEEEFTLYMNQAKKLKHEADGIPNNRERQAMKYLEAVLYFILCGTFSETRGDYASAYTMYKETLNLVHHVTRPLRSSESAAGGTDNKLAILSLRCQSLLYLKLYKLRRTEVRECQQKLGDLLNHVSTHSLPHTSPGGGLGGTPSPAGSDGSGTSGYTSSGEGTMSVPHSLMQKQYHYSNYLTQCHELWDVAELFTTRGHCQDFIAHLDQACGTLTLHSSLKDLVKYTQAGLDYLAKERESLLRARRL